VEELFHCLVPTPSLPRLIFVSHALSGSSHFFDFFSTPFPNGCFSPPVTPPRRCGLQIPVLPASLCDVAVCLSRLVRSVVFLFFVDEDPDAPPAHQAETGGSLTSVEFGALPRTLTCNAHGPLSPDVAVPVDASALRAR